MDSFHDTATHIVSLLDQEDHAEAPRMEGAKMVSGSSGRCEGL